MEGGYKLSDWMNKGEGDGTADYVPVQLLMSLVLSDLC